MLEDLQELLSTLNSVGIEAVVIDAPEETEDGEFTSLVRGANKEGNIIVFHTIDGKYFDAPMGTMTVKGLMSRIELFDVTKAKTEHTVVKDIVKNLTIKQGRKKVSFTCSSPKTLAIPSRVPPFDMDNTYALTKENIELLNSAIAAMSMTGSKVDRFISIAVSNNVLSVRIFDGEDDSFVDEFELKGDNEDSPEFSWDVPAFQRVMRQAQNATVDQRAEFNVSEQGIAIFNIGVVNVLLPPIRVNK